MSEQTVDSYTAAAPQRNVVSRIWNDKQTRSVIVQIIALILLLLFFGSMVRNAIANLEALGKGFSFSFLSTASNYDINQKLGWEYDSRSPHIKATLVGISNTLLVAVSGIILSTVLGFILGVLRLSKNWLTNKLAHVYIEYVRNVPVLLHILLVHGILVHSLPAPRESKDLAETFFLNKRGLFLPTPETPFLGYAILLFFGLVLAGLVFSYFFKRWAQRIQDETGVGYPVFWINLFAYLVLPILVTVGFLLFVGWEQPELKGFNFRGGGVIRPEFMALWLALSFYTAAFIGEIVRAGITAVSKGQTEASLALGIPRGKTLSLVVIPQALRVIVPPLTSQYLNITKNSSLAIAIGYMDITATIGGISLNQTGREMECMIIVMALYLTFSLLISMFMNWYNSRIKLVER